MVHLPVGLLLRGYVTILTQLTYGLSQGINFQLTSVPLNYHPCTLSSITTGYRFSEEDRHIES